MRSGFYCFLLFFGGPGGDDMGDFWLYEMELLICPSDAVLKENSHYQTSLPFLAFIHFFFMLHIFSDKRTKMNGTDALLPLVTFRKPLV